MLVDCTLVLAGGAAAPVFWVCPLVVLWVWLTVDWALAMSSKLMHDEQAKVESVLHDLQVA